jgi:hypothetical protein
MIPVPDMKDSRIGAVRAETLAHLTANNNVK